MGTESNRRRRRRCEIEAPRQWQRPAPRPTRPSCGLARAPGARLETRNERGRDESQWVAFSAASGVVAAPRHRVPCVVGPPLVCPTDLDSPTGHGLSSTQEPETDAALAVDHPRASHAAVAVREAGHSPPPRERRVVAVGHYRFRSAADLGRWLPLARRSEAVDFEAGPARGPLMGDASRSVVRARDSAVEEAMDAVVRPIRDPSPSGPHLPSLPALGRRAQKGFG